MTTGNFETLRVKDVVSFAKGKPPAEQPYFGSDAELYLTPEYLRGGVFSEPIKANKNAVRVSGGETIVLWDGSNAGEVFRARPGVLSSTMVHLKSENSFDDDYFFYAMKGWEGYLKGQTSGSGIPHVDKEVLGKLALFRYPINEQVKIAKILATVDQAIEQTEALIAKQQRIKTGLMQDLLTCGIDEHGQLRTELTHAFKDSPLGRIPVEWQVRTFAEVAEISRGKFTHRPRNDPAFYEGDYPFVQTGDVTRNVGRKLTEYSQTLNERGRGVSKEFPTGTIAITIAANIADTAILGIPMCFPDSVVGAVVQAPNDVRFVELLVRRWKPVLEQLAPQSAQRNINLETLKPLLMAMPDGEEQRRIGALYETVEMAQIDLMAQCSKQLALKTALMQELLTGRKRVTDLLEPVAA